jgi:hypothetical protein
MKGLQKMTQQVVGSMNDFYNLFVEPKDDKKRGVDVIKEICNRHMNIDFKTKSVHIKAIQFIIENFNILRNWCDIEIDENDCTANLNGRHLEKFDWVVRSDDGEFHVHSPEMFESMYEQAPGQFLFG